MKELILKMIINTPGWLLLLVYVLHIVFVFYMGQLNAYLHMRNWLKQLGLKFRKL